MNDESKTKEQLIEELAKARRRIAALEALECELMQAEEILSKPRVLLQRIFDVIPDLVTVYDTEYRVVTSNWKGYEHIPMEVREGDPYCYKCFMERDTPCEPCYIREVFDTRECSQFEHISPFDGTLREVHACPIFNDAGEVILAVAHIRNIEESAARQEALAENHEADCV